MRGIVLGAGVAVVALGALKSLDSATAATLLGIGLAALAITQLDIEK